MAYEAVPENLIIEQFAEFLYSAEFGALAPAENINLVLDKKTRYKTQGDKGSKTSGIYMIHSDGCPAGYAINYKISGEAFNWRFDFEKLKGDKKYNKFYDISQTPEFKAEAERVKREHEAREAKEKAEALEKAKKEFASAVKLINPELEYLKRKKVKIFGELKSDAKGNIILPLKNIKGEFMSLQRIAPDGGKLFATDAVTAGAFFNIDLDKAKNNLDKPILICEGYATGATLYELTGCPVVCAMNCYNLARVSEAIRKKFKSHKIIIMADNDAKTKSERGFNPGIDHAQEANKKFKLDGVFYPEFSVFSAAAGKSDWNDYYCEFGEQKARAILDKSIKYACMTPQEKERRDRIIKIENQSPIINAADLLKKEFPPIKWAVPGIIPTGLTMLSGNPKAGKSLMALHFALAIAFGGYALGSIKCEQGRVLYLALEDTEQRLQRRLRQSLFNLTDTRSLTNLDLKIELPRQNDGGIEYIDNYLQEHQDTRLVIVDTFQKFRKQLSSKGNVYSEDYDAAADIKKLGDTHSVGILNIHHLRKAPDTTDPFNEMSGSNGLAGAADTNIIWKRQRLSSTGTLEWSGRDIEEKKYNVKCENLNGAFNWILGDEVTEDSMGANNLSQDKQDIINYLQDNPGKSPKEIADALKVKNYDALIQRLSRMAKDGLLYKTGSLYYTGA